MIKTKILIVEDEPKVAEFIKRGLEENDFGTEIAYDGQTGRSLALSGRFELIILDVNLPHINGFELCRLIRKENEKVPIIMLTALGSVDDKLNGFDAGADDYLIKPFEFRELLARIKALLKRNLKSEAPERLIRIADLEINQESKMVKRGNKKIDLTAKEYALLEYLAKNKNRVISRNDIASRVWDINFDTGTNVIDVYINFLRKKIDKDYDKKLIHTYIGMGYILKDEE
ncbi:MAG: response regulator transcription factor [Cyclobacteriaceae bacterium]|nr:response regulator transcription factor [Cyclobacteriaceae bacterium]